MLRAVRFLVAALLLHSLGNAALAKAPTAPEVRLVLRSPLTACGPTG